MEGPGKAESRDYTFAVRSFQAATPELWILGSMPPPGASRRPVRLIACVRNPGEKKAAPFPGPPRLLLF